MKNIDNDIEQFETNLVEINNLKNQISELKATLEKMLKETEDIESIKENISKEVELIHKISEENKKQVSLIKKTIEDNSLKENKHFKIIIVLLVISIIIGVVGLFI